MAASFERRPDAGYRVVGVCVPGRRHAPGSTVDVDGHRVPVLGDQTEVLAALQFAGATMVAVTDAEALGAAGMRDLGWQLASVEADLVVSPRRRRRGGSATGHPARRRAPVAPRPGAAVRRCHPAGEAFGRPGGGRTQPGGRLSGDGRRCAGRRGVEPWPGAVPRRSGSVAAVPPSRCSSSGPWSSARTGCVAQLAARDDGAGPLFKVHSDPRVTRVGRVLRRFSVDELPQLVNRAARAR